jgi:general secretion pathway protein H
MSFGKTVKFMNSIISSLQSQVFDLRRKGFTLLELIVVLFILSLVLAVSFPSLSGIGENRTNSDAKRLASIVRYLNDSAIATKNTLHMKIAFADRAVSYHGPDGDKSEKFDSLSAIELPTKGMVSEGEIIVFFSPLGASESFTMYLRDDKSEMQITFNALSGRVKITKGDAQK